MPVFRVYVSSKGFLGSRVVLIYRAVASWASQISQNKAAAQITGGSLPRHVSRAEHQVSRLSSDEVPLKTILVDMRSGSENGQQPGHQL